MLIGAEDHPPYRRPMVSKDLLAGKAAAARLLLEPAEFWAANDIDLRPATTVEQIDTGSGRVHLAGSGPIGYDSLLIATGARARRLAGSRGASIHTLRGVADVAPLHRTISEDGSLLIIGAGLIGCEAAATARTLGAQVTVLHAGNAPLDRIAPPAVSEFYRKLHIGHGVDFNDNIALQQVENVDDRCVIATSGTDRNWMARTALIAIGSTPDTALAQAAGLLVDNGIVVDEQYRTSAPGVFAAGDVASRYSPLLGRRERTEHWNSAQEQGAAAAAAILGQSTAAVAVPWGWTNQYGLNLQFAGWIHPDDEVVYRGSPETPNFSAWAVRDGRVIGAMGIGRPADIRAARTLIGSEIPIDTTELADESIDPAAIRDSVGR